MSVEINGGSYGVLSTGFSRPSKVDLLEQLRSDALNESFGFGSNADVGTASPLGRFLAVLAEREDAYWRAMEAIYYAGYVPTANGAALTLKAAEMGIVRRAAAKATAILTIVGDAGTVIPEGDVWQADSGVLFQTTEQAIITSRGRVDVAIEAVEAGVDGNVAAETITTEVVSIQGVASGSNAYDPGTVRVIGANVQGAIEVPADGARNDYQTVKRLSIEHPHCLDDILVTVRNDSGGTALFNFRVEVYDHLTGELLGTTETQTFELDDDEVKVVSFTGQSIDVHGIAGDWVRIVFVNEETSEATLSVCYDDANQYTDGALYANATEQVGYDAVLRLTSRLTGASSGGDDGETDSELRLRYLYTSATFGSATQEAVGAQLWRIPGVHAVSVRQNRMNVEVDGMNPHSVEATVYGGDPDLIGAAILMSVPAGCETLGNAAVTVLDSIGQAHVVRYNRAERIPIYVSVSLTVDGSFSHDAALTAMSDAIIQYIGGEDSTGQFNMGLLPAADVIYSKILALVMSIAGVVDASVTLDVTPDPAATSNIAIDTAEVAETKAEYIVIEVVA